jgi:hypothetical protein
MDYYKDWPLFETLPAGWKFSKAAGSPLTGYAFATSASPLKGGKTALVKVIAKPVKPPEVGVSAAVSADKGTAKSGPKKQFSYDASQAKTVNDLARQKFKQRLLQDILVDLMICEIESWDKREYIRELQNLIGSIGA